MENEQSHSSLNSALDHWLTARDPASMRWCPYCQKNTVTIEGRFTGTLIGNAPERVVQKSCSECNGFVSRTILPPLEVGNA